MTNRKRSADKGVGSIGLVSRCDAFIWRCNYTWYGQYKCPPGWRNWWAFSEEHAFSPDRQSFRDAVLEDLRCMY